MTFGKALLIGAGLAAVATAQRPKFEVASIKRSPPAGPDTVERWVRESSRGRMRLENFPLRALIQYAYGIRPFEISGGPAWTLSEPYEIIAKAEKPADAQEMRLMLQSLLDDRFQLKLHRESRELPVYHLSVATSGKLPQPREGNCKGSDARVPPEPRAPGLRMLGPCGSILMPVKPPAEAELYGGKITMAALVSRLTDILGRPVIDRTGFTSTFDLDVRFALDDSLAGVPRRSQGFAAAEPSGLPSLFTAMQEQLGLKIAAAKGPIEILVIDSAERPSAN